MNNIFGEVKSKKKKIVFDAKIKKNKKEERKALRKAVNAFDESFGCDLKHPRMLVDNEYDYYKNVDAAKADLTTILCKMNSVNAENYVFYDDFFGSTIQKVKMKKLKKNSCFFDGNIHPYKDPVFACRFMSYLTRYLIKHLEEIVNNSYRLNKDGKWIEYEQKMDYLNTLMERYLGCMEGIFKGSSCTFDLLYFYEMTMYVELPKKKSVGKAYEIYEVSTHLDDLSGFFSFAKESTKMIDVLEASYMVCTNSFKIPNFSVGNKWFYSENEVKELLKELGKEIRLSIDKSGVPKLFRYFLRACPEASAVWEEKSKDFQRGMYAVAFFCFLTRNKKVERMIEKLMSI